jgi:dihydrofolate synthase/folylpolyglutamate synthase
MTKVSNLTEAQEYLFSLIPKQERTKFPGDLGLARAKYFLTLLDNPQEKLRVVHVAGTSGKGSTCYLLSTALKGLGFKVGLTLSPHLLDIRERFQINNDLLPEAEFCQHLNELIPYVEQVEKAGFGRVTYFEILVVLAFWVFAKNKVDYAVVETGMGGTYDATNTVSRPDKLTIITRLGIDHQKILGNSLKKIATQKAGIIQPNNQVISPWQKKEARAVLDKAVKGGIFYLKNPTHFRRVRVLADKTVFTFEFENLRLKEIGLGLVGKYQAENCALALAGLTLLAQRDGFVIDERLLRQVLREANFKGRFNLLRKGESTVVIDGAHNPQKMTSFLESLREVFPGQRFVFLVAFKRGKDYKKMLKSIIPLAEEIVATRFFGHKQDMIQFSELPENVGQFLAQNNFNSFRTIEDQEAALDYVFSKGSKILVITGSLYLISEIYPQIKEGK